MPRTRLCDLLDIEHPIISAPMAGTATAPLAAAVSAAGGFGMIGASDPTGPPERPDWLREQIRGVREQTDRPFGVGMVLSWPGADALTEVALAEGVAAVAYSFGDPAPYIERAHNAGVKVLVQEQTVAAARAAAIAGADVVAAQGTEGGGHTGEIGTLAIVPAVVDAIGEVPTVAAGGIADGRGLAAALMLGAVGVWMGTRFVASEEWAGGAWRQGRIVAASADDTIWTRAYDLSLDLPFPEAIGGRALRTPFTDEWHGRDDETIANRERLQSELTAPGADENPRLAPVWTGSAAGLIHAIEPAGDIVRRVAAEADQLLQGAPTLINVTA